MLGWFFTPHVFTPSQWLKCSQFEPLNSLKFVYSHFAAPPPPRFPPLIQSDPNHHQHLGSGVSWLGQRSSQACKKMGYLCSIPVSLFNLLITLSRSPYWNGVLSFNHRWKSPKAKIQRFPAVKRNPLLLKNGGTLFLLSPFLPLSLICQTKTA